MITVKKKWDKCKSDRDRSHTVIPSFGDTGLKNAVMELTL